MPLTNLALPPSGKARRAELRVVWTSSAALSFKEEIVSYRNHLPRLQDTKSFTRNCSNIAEKLLLIFAMVLGNILPRSEQWCLNPCSSQNTSTDSAEVHVQSSVHTAAAGVPCILITILSIKFGLLLKVLDISKCSRNGALEGAPAAPPTSEPQPETRRDFLLKLWGFGMDGFLLWFSSLHFWITFSNILLQLQTLELPGFPISADSSYYCIVLGTQI